MCLILAMHPGCNMPDALWANALVYNPHGYGVSYPEDGKIVIEKRLNWDIFEFADRVRQLSDKPRLVHMRYATVGKIDDDNCRPFHVVKGNQPNHNWAFCHNGTLRIDGLVPKNSEWNDSRHFLVKYLQPIMKHNPDVIKEPAFQNILLKTIGINRLAFINGNGEFVILNSDRGFSTQHGGIWMSNGYSISTPWDKDRENPQGKVELLLLEQLAKEKSDKRKAKLSIRRKSRNAIANLYKDKELDTWYRIVNGKRVYSEDWPDAITIEAKIAEQAK